MTQARRLIPLFLIFLLFTADVVEARVSGPTDWRWRNDDGTEKTATWMTDEENQSGILVGTKEIARLRAVLTAGVDFSNLTVAYGDPAETADYSEFFAFADSDYLENGDPVSQLLSVDDSLWTYEEGGQVLEEADTVPGASADTDYPYQEIELCLKARDDVTVPEDTYTFAFNSIQAPLVYRHARVAEIETLAVTDIAETSVTAVGDIIDLGLRNPQAHGVCWSTVPEPDINDNLTDEGEINETGEFSTVVPDLTPGTTYYLRAYTTNSAGTAYGETVSFTTDGSPDKASYGAGNCFIRTAMSSMTIFSELLEYWRNYAGH